MLQFFYIPAISITINYWSLLFREFFKCIGSAGNSLSFYDVLVSKNCIQILHENLCLQTQTRMRFCLFPLLGDYLQSSWIINLLFAIFSKHRPRFREFFFNFKAIYYPPQKVNHLWAERSALWISCKITRIFSFRKSPSTFRSIADIEIALLLLKVCGQTLSKL